MNENERYKNVFDTIGTDTEITVETLTSRKREKKAAGIRKAACGFAAFAVFILGSNMVSYAKDGEFWITKVFNFKTASGVEVSIEEEQIDEYSSSTKLTITTDDKRDFFEVDGNKLYFSLDGTRTDITDQCDDDRYYKQEYTDEEGYRHIMIVGGTPETAGSAEYVLDKDGMCVFSDTSGDVPLGDMEMISQSVAVTDDSGKVDVSVFSEEEFEDLKQELEKTTGEDFEDSGEDTEDTYFYSDESYDPMENAPNWLKNAEKDLQIQYR